MTLEGNLIEFSAPRLLSLISLAKKTGTLHLYRPARTNDQGKKRKKDSPAEKRATIAFREGRLILASTGDEDGQLVTMLQKAGKLNAAQARVICERGANYTDKALALMLINANCITRDDIVHSVRQYTLDIVFDVITWNLESFVFEENVLPSPGRITVSIDVKQVIQEGMRRAQEFKPLEVELPNLDVAIKFPDAPGDLFQGVSLGVEEWRVVLLVNSKNTIRQIAKSCDMTDTEVRRVVYGLLQAGLVELVKRPGMHAIPGNSATRRVSAIFSLLSL